ncbi:hypothetical protein SAMN03159488_05389 [Pseudomonas sp. NFIX10]|nr:hypothetical protein SAMN03159488_05389 [Pseudomonas sp. NFIX10]SFF51412.1 hypothetical protein SAMN03159367_04993 [Pseudomonas sp. NFACC06-1]
MKDPPVIKHCFRRALSILPHCRSKKPATFIHEVSHQLFDTLDIIYLDAVLPFLDLISTATYLGQVQYAKQKGR